MGRIRKVSFSANQIIVNSERIDFDFSKTVTDECTDSQKMDGKVTSIRIFKKFEFENRFIGFYFQEGDMFPYSPKVIKSTSEKMEEIDNPKKPDEIEANDQQFALIDVETQIIYVSDQRRVNTLIEWLADKTRSEISIKPLFEKEEFLQKIKSVSEVSLTVVPNLFNQYDSKLLSAKLSEDIFGFGADEATLTMKYKSRMTIDGIKDKMQSIMGKKSTFEKLTIVGRTADDFSSVFNTDGVVNKVSVECMVDDGTGKFEEGELFHSLIIKIKQNEKE